MQKPDSSKATIEEVQEAINRFKGSGNIKRDVDKEGFLFEESYGPDGKPRILYFYKKANGELEARPSTFIEKVQKLLGSDNRVKVDPVAFKKAQEALEVKKMPKIKTAD